MMKMNKFVIFLTVFFALAVLAVFAREVQARIVVSYPGSGTTVSKSVFQQYPQAGNYNGSRCYSFGFNNRNRYCYRSYCGDGQCNNRETRYSCPQDCGPLCNNQCSIGSHRCSGASSQTCVSLGGNCASWGNYNACDPRCYTCGNGNCDLGCGETQSTCPQDCGSLCSNQCSTGSRRCSGNITYQICGDYNNDGCGEWGNVTKCSGNQTCTGGNCNDICQPKTCTYFNYQCGTVNDGCGNTLNCGTCASNQTCNNGRCENVCQPKTCAYFNYNCGTVSDGCGNTLNCGTCATNQICTNGRCENTCQPKTCAYFNYNCGTVSDGCGNNLNCGTCASNQTCNNGRCENVCQPKTCSSLGYQCGSASDGCGNTLNCGTCAANQTCKVGKCEDDCQTSCDTSCEPNRKRIFVTSGTYSFRDNAVFSGCGYPISKNVDETWADGICAKTAADSGLKGTYKALIYIGKRDPMKVLAAGRSFWNIEKTGNNRCEWHIVAQNPVDFFTDEGANSYLRNPIRFTEQGYALDNVSVWTSIKPLGEGNYSLLETSTGVYPCRAPQVNTVCYTPEMVDMCATQYCHVFNTTGGANVYCTSATAWYGNTSSKGLEWSYKLWTQKDNDARNVCVKTNRAFYCVEQ